MRIARLLMLVLVVTMMACTENNYFTAPVANDEGSIVLPPFLGQALEVSPGSAFYQSLAFNVPLGVFPQLDVTFVPNNGVLAFQGGLPEPWMLGNQSGGNTLMRPWMLGLPLVAQYMGEADVVVTVRGTKQQSRFHVTVKQFTTGKG